MFDPVLPGEGSCWRDLVLDDRRVSVRRRLRLDLSGVAKGFAVDRACDRLREAGAISGLVNAGGDLRVFGGGETIALSPRHSATPAAVWVEDGALASSDVAGSTDEYGEPQHRDGRTAKAVHFGFVSVAAPLCADADALTKVVLAVGNNAAPLLASRGAVAYAHGIRKGWYRIGD